jgi:hypothetical protein
MKTTHSPRNGSKTSSMPDISLMGNAETFNFNYVGRDFPCLIPEHRVERGMK